MIEDAGAWRVREFSEPTATLATLVSVPTNGTKVNAPVDIRPPLSEFVFAATQGQRYAVRVTPSTVTSGTVAVVARSGASTTTPISSSKGFVDTFVASASLYEIIVAPTPGQTGTVDAEVLLVTDATGTLTPGGASVPLALTTPGQNGVLTMNATAGQVITVTASSSTIGSGTLRVLRPDGSTQIETPFATGTTTLADIPILTTGAYQVVVDPAADATGAVTIAAGLSTAVSGQKTTLGEQLRKIIRGKLLSSSTPYACPRHSP